jgi:hypothetical protein
MIFFKRSQKLKKYILLAQNTRKIKKLDLNFFFLKLKFKFKFKFKFDFLLFIFFNLKFRTPF